MRPEIVLDANVFSANAAAWRALVAPAQLYAVVKANGYNWGIERVVPLLEPYADAFCVADVDELRALRAVSDKRAIVLGRVPHGQLAAVLAQNAVATMETEEDVRSGIAAGIVRLGLRPAALWSGCDVETLRSFAPLLARCDAAVELWTHLPDLSAIGEQLALFAAARNELLSAGIRAVRCDVASTRSFAAGARTGAQAVRIGIGFFGSTNGVPLAGIRCAVAVSAPVVKIAHAPEGMRLGYGGTTLPVAQKITTVRAGYSDGLPKALEGTDDILSVGMQYMTVRGQRAAQDPVRILDSSTDLDAVAERCGRLPHELVVTLGKAAC